MIGDVGFIDGEPVTWHEHNVRAMAEHAETIIGQLISRPGQWARIDSTPYKLALEHALGRAWAERFGDSAGLEIRWVNDGQRDDNEIPGSLSCNSLYARWSANG